MRPVHPIAALQTEWSLFSREIETEVVPACRKLGIGIVTYSPLGRGLLTRAITSTVGLADNDFRRLAQPRFQDGDLEHNLAVVRIFQGIAAEKDATPAQLALAWVHARETMWSPSRAPGGAATWIRTW